MANKALVKKELNIFDYLSQVLPLLDIIFILWIALNSQQPWITTPIHLAMPVLGFSSLFIFREKGRLGFYIIGTATIIPAFTLNLWGSETCPTWLTEFSFITGGLMLALSWPDKIVVLLYAFASTIIPFWISRMPAKFITQIVIAELAIWFLLERSMYFMSLQQKKITEQKELIEDRQKEIIDSIHYAKRIQDSLLPTEKYIDRHLNFTDKT